MTPGKESLTSLGMAKTMSERIRFYRLEREMSVRDLATAVGVTPTRVHQYESGEDPTVARVYKIAGALGVSPKQIIGDGPETGKA